MNPHLHHILAQQRIVDLQRAAQHARLVTGTGIRRRDQLAGVVHELLDAHADTEHLSRTQHSELWWHAHLRDLRDLQRVAREVLADVS